MSHKPTSPKRKISSISTFKTIPHSSRNSQIARESFQYHCPKQITAILKATSYPSSFLGTYTLNAPLSQAINSEYNGEKS